MKKIICIILISLFAKNVQSQVTVKDSISRKPFTLTVTLENRKLNAVFTNSKNAKSVYKFYTNFITFDEFEQELKTAASVALELDTSDTNIKQEIKLKAFPLYAEIPTESISTTDSGNAALILHVNKNVPLYDKHGNKMIEDAYLYLSEILLDAELDFRTNFLNRNKENLIIKKSMDFEIKWDKKKPGIKIPASFGKDTILNLISGITVYELKDRSYTSDKTIFENVTYLGPVKNCQKKQIVLKKELLDAVLKSKDSTKIKGELEIEIERNSLPLYKSLQDATFASYEDIADFSKKHAAEWKVISPEIRNGLLDAKDFKVLNFELQKKIGKVTFENLVGKNKKINSLEELYTFAENNYKNFVLAQDTTRKKYILSHESIGKKDFKKIKNNLNKTYYTINETISNFLNRFETRNNSKLNIESINLVVKQGMVEEIRVSGFRNNNFEIYENIIPFAVSSKANIVSADGQWLFQKGNKRELKIDLGDVLLLEKNLEVNTKDFSPDDLSRKFIISKDKDIFYLVRDPNREIIDVKAFTDIMGINSKSPNGLIQIEASHLFKLWTTKKQFFKTALFGGLLEYIKPYIQLSKLENKERYLALNSNDSIRNGQYTSRQYAPMIDFYRYQTLQAGIALNIGMLGFDNIKCRFYLDAGAQYVGTGFYNITNKYNGSQLAAEPDTSYEFAGNLIWYPELRLQIAETSRIGAEFGIRYNKMYILHREVMYSNSENYEDRYRGTFKTFFGELFYKPVSKSKVYARAIFNVQNTIYKKHFYQLQIGYNTSIYKNLK